MGSGGSNCPYYQSYKYCIKKRGDVNDDFFSRYCMSDYNYTECPIYKQEDSSSEGCFLTSACVENKGLPDDCQELTQLRWYRDSILPSQPDGQTKIAEYYHIAPQIVENINCQPDKKDIYDRIYSDYILPCTEMISNGNYDDVYQKYCDMVYSLKEKYMKKEL